MQNLREVTIAKIVAVAIFVAVFAGSWDIWWHGAVGRDSFWIPPHLLLYASIVAAVLVVGLGWYLHPRSRWRAVAVALFLVPLAAPLDELWHRTFGRENKDGSSVARRFFGAMVFASVLNLAFFLAEPIWPTGPWELLGFWGAGVIAAVLVLVFLSAHRWLPGVGDTTLTAIFAMLVAAVRFDEVSLSPTVVPPHGHAPWWLVVLSIVVPAIFVDVSGHFSKYARAGLIGFLWAGILFGFSSYFFPPELQYGATQVLQALVSALVGGVVAGVVFSKFKKLA